MDATADSSQTQSSLSISEEVATSNERMLEYVLSRKKWKNNIDYYDLIVQQYLQP